MIGKNARFLCYFQLLFCVLIWNSYWNNPLKHWQIIQKIWKNFGSIFSSLKNLILEENAEIFVENFMKIHDENLDSSYFWSSKIFLRWITEESGRIVQGLRVAKLHLAETLIERKGIFPFIRADLQLAVRIIRAPLQSDRTKSLFTKIQLKAGREFFKVISETDDNNRNNLTSVKTHLNCSH